jgi:hypothetical protein
MNTVESRRAIQPRLYTRAGAMNRCRSQIPRKRNQASRFDLIKLTLNGAKINTIHL